MEELSIFIDESGDVGCVSDFYLVSLVFHEQKYALSSNIREYELGLASRHLDCVPFHFNPLINGNDEYKWKDIQNRKRQLGTFAAFVNKLPIRYEVFDYQKRKGEYNPELLSMVIEKDLESFLFAHIECLQKFDIVKIYYDGGQSVVSQAVHGAIASCVFREAVVYRDAIAERYRLSQVADYVCGVELTALKFEGRLETKTDAAFFGEYGTFKKNYLKKLRRKRMQ